jgi:hypothetical protein
VNGPKWTFILLCGLIVLAPSAPAAAQFLPGGGVDTTDPELPPPGVYLSPQDVHAMYAGPSLTIVLQAIQHQPFKDLDPAHLPNADGTGTNEHHDFDSDLRGQGSCIDAPNAFGACAAANIPPSFPVMMEGRVQTVALNKGPTDTTGLFATEMVGMSLSGTGPTPPFVMVREGAPPSLGQTRIMDNGDGTYHIDSFFDVFTELSFDGGANWFPSIGPTRVNLVPEPSSVVLAALALIAAVGYVRRR